ncbi:MAG: ABC transporter ATP-binding protein [Desulfobacula sp.]|nr:ABC transporter ATP-binding protein [Desulfobacula sp.]
MLKVSGASKKFQGHEIFSKFNFSVPKGEFHIMIGPSGCGKSTLLDGLTGTIELDQGSIIWNNSCFHDLSRCAAYMQQKDLLLPWFSLNDNVLLPARVGSLKMDMAKEQGLKLMEQMGLKGYESFMPSQVSGGMRQRCALARTLMFNRDLILLDEPLSALDTITRNNLQSLLLMLQQKFKKTILMITHDIDEALLLADRIYLLSNRPMGILKQYRLDLPKPRKFNNPGLLDIKEDVFKRLEGAVICESY